MFRVERKRKQKNKNNNETNKQNTNLEFYRVNYPSKVKETQRLSSKNKKGVNSLPAELPSSK